MLSVVFPTRNRSVHLRRALSNLMYQTILVQDFEVIVVDNGSNDDTERVCQESSQNFKHFHYMIAKEPGLHVARHLGCKQACGDIVVFADDDIIPFPTWLKAVRKAFNENDVALVGGKNLPKWEVDPPDWIRSRWQPNEKGERILGSLSIIDLGDDPREINPLLVFGCNYAIRRELIVRAGGFHPDSMPDDLIKYRGD